MTVLRHSPTLSADDFTASVILAAARSFRPGTDWPNVDGHTCAKGGAS